MKKLISVSLPCRNEEKNIEPLVKEIIAQFETHMPEYNYQIQFIDNCSTDNTRTVLRQVCAQYSKVRAIFNVASFSGSAFHGILQTTGDCCIHMASDFQDPPSLIPQLVREWEKGAVVVCAIKTSSEENKILWWARSLYYKIISSFSNVKQISHFTGFGLYDREFIEIIRSLKDPTPTLRGLVAEYGYRIAKVDFVQPKRQSGKSSNNFYRLFDYAMRNITSYTNIGIRLATFSGIIISLLSFAVGFVYLVLKLIFWNRFSAGVAPMLIGMFFLGAVQLFFIGFLGEYIYNINVRLMNRPYAIEEERVNFPEQEKAKDHGVFDE
jgi:glycosyltransferase involved in cell wall biosynthesis